MSKELLAKFGFTEQDIIADAPNGMTIPTNYPKPEERFRLVFEDYSASIEEAYFWHLNHFRTGLSFQRVEKITDVFSASEQSAFWAAGQQRLGLQQQNASTYMRGVSELLKALFQLVRELRDLDMRIKYYTDTHNKEKGWESSEITLKGLWVDLVEGGAKSPASVYGMAQQLGFTILPDLFFRVHIDDAKDIHEKVQRLEFNPKVKEVLERKLRQFMEWKIQSYKELNARRSWTLKYLRQHYNTIRLYTSWIKPYLKNAKRLSMSGDGGSSPDLIAAFETSLTEIEILAILPRGKVNIVVNMNFLHKTKPSMDYQKDGYQHRGPLHVGEITMEFRGYLWTDKEIENFKMMREEEDMQLIGDYDKSIADAMDSLGDDLKDYLKEAGEKFPEPNKPIEKKKKTDWTKVVPIAEPFIAVAGGLKELFGNFIPKIEMTKKDDSKEKWKLNKDRSGAKGLLLVLLWLTYKNYKKAHRMITW